MSLRYPALLLARTTRSRARFAHLKSPFYFQPRDLLVRTITMASLPKTMKGVLIEETGGPEVLLYKTDLPVPTLKEGEILVKNDFAGINYIDTYFRTGLYPAPKPEILGREGEGTIVAMASLGDFYGLKKGDKVVWLATSAYAEYTAVPASKAILIPYFIKPGIAAAALLQGLTALTLIREAHLVKANDWVLVHAAAGGVGLWLMQLLRIVGAQTIATASTPEKLELAKENGAMYALNYKTESVIDRVMDITGGDGVVAVFDSTGKDQFENDLVVVSRKGSIVSFGNASGAVPPFAIARLSAKNIKLLRPTLFNYIYERAEYERYANELFDLIQLDGIEVRIHETYPLEEVARAHADIESRKTTGKLLLKI